MIELSRLNGKKFFLNCDLIKTLEATPDTVITLTNGEKLMVLEPIDTVISQTIAFRQALLRGPIVNYATALQGAAPPSPTRGGST